MAAPATVTGATRQRQINDVFYVALGAFPTIQSAISFVSTFNNGVGQIVVTYGSTDATAISTLTGGGPTIFITDLRQSQNQNWSWNGTSFVPEDDVQLTGFIAQGNAAAHLASTAIGYDPAGDSGNGSGNIVVTSNTGKPLPAISITGQASDGSGAHTFLRTDSTDLDLNPDGGAVLVNGSEVLTDADFPPGALIDNRNLAASANLSVPLTPATATLGTVTPGGDAANILRTGFCIYIGPDIYNPGDNLDPPRPGTTFTGVIRNFSIFNATNDPSRTVEFYLLQRDISGVCTPYFSTGPIGAPASGVFSYDVPNGIAVRCNAGTVIGVATTSTQANGITYASFTGAASSILIGSQTSLQVGTPYTAGVGGVTADTHTIPAFQATFQREGVLLPTRFGNVASGYARLDVASQVQTQQLSKSLALTSNTYVTPPTTTTQTVGATGTSAGSTTGTFLLTSSPTAGFDSVVRSIQVSLPVGSTATIELLVLKPVAVEEGLVYTVLWTSGAIPHPLPLPSSPYIYTNPDPMAARFQVGCILAISVDGNIPYTTAAGTALGINLGKPGTLVVGKTYGLDYDQNGVPNPANPVRFQSVNTVPLVTMTLTHEAAVVPTIWANLPGGYVQPDANGNLPVTMYRKTDQPWSGKKVSAVGTSITAMNPAANGVATTTGFINQTFGNCQMIGTNFAIGASMLCFPPGGDAAHSSLSATSSELLGLGLSAHGSYEYSILSFAPDLVIIDHGIQDAGVTSGAMFAGNGSLNVDRSTFLGAYNFVIDKIISNLPNCRIVLLTPPTIYYPGTVNPTPTTPDANKNAGIVQRCTDIKAIGAYYGFPVLDVQEELGLHARAVMPAQSNTNNFGTIDGSNPTLFTHNRMARLLTQFLNGM